MKSFSALMAIFLVGINAHARVELSCEGIGTFTKSKKVAEVKVSVESRERQCIVEIKVGDSVAPRGWRVDCPEDGNFAVQIFEPSNGDFLLDLGTTNSLEVYYRSGNLFKTSHLDCQIAEPKVMY